MHSTVNKNPQKQFKMSKSTNRNKKASRREIKKKEKKISSAREDLITIQ